mmetsp:Transcript_14084/g.26319  ORF Transcript_14084/g.26319 Transcript_14084/m.26319 type:complete len:116 (-) Transcript_14084:152-499(-)
MGPAPVLERHLRRCGHDDGQVCAAGQQSRCGGCPGVIPSIADAGASSLFDERVYGGQLLCSDREDADGAYDLEPRVLIWASRASASHCAGTGRDRWDHRLCGARFHACACRGSAL